MTLLQWLIVAMVALPFLLPAACLVAGTVAAVFYVLGLGALELAFRLLAATRWTWSRILRRPV